MALSNVFVGELLHALAGTCCTKSKWQLSHKQALTQGCVQQVATQFTSIFKGGVEEVRWGCQFLSDYGTILLHMDMESIILQGLMGS